MQNNSKPKREKIGRKYLFYRYSILLLLFVAAVTIFLTRNTSDRSQIVQNVAPERAPTTHKDATATAPLDNSKAAPSTAGLSAGPQQPSTAKPPTRQKDPIQKEAFFDKRANREFQVVKGEVMVRFKKGVTQNEVTEILKNLEATIFQERKQLGVYRLRIPQNVSVSDFITQHEKNEKLQFVEPNFIAATLGSLTNAPNDPLYSSQWGLAKIQAEKAWETTTGSSNVIVAVLDSGIEVAHPDLKNKVVPGYDFVNGDNDPSDDHGHGTHVAGIIAAEGNNSIGVIGVAPDCSVMPVKVIDGDGEGMYSDVVDGLIYAAEHGARIINLSIGGYGYSQTLADAVDYAHSQGAVLVAAAGNDGSSNPIYPAAYPNVIAVSATDSADQIWPSSNQGSYIKLSAPGVGVVSATLNGEYANASGTSASAALGSGVAALIFSKKPDFSNTQVGQILLQTATDLGESGRDLVFGYGRLTADEALEVATIEIHDLAVIKVKLEPRSFKIGEAVQVVITVQNQGTFVESALKIKAFVSNKEIGALATVESLRVGQIVPVAFNWIPDNAGTTNDLVISGEIIPVVDEVETDDNKKRIFYKYDPEGGAYLLYKQIPYVHSWAALQAYNILPSGAAKTEISSYLYGGTTFSFLFGSSKVWRSQYTVPVSWSSDTKSGTSVLEGAWEEDEGSYGILPTSLRHFWNPDGGFNDGLDVIGLNNDSNLSQAQAWWDQAVAVYPSNKDLAYYYLGHVAHLLGDLGVPEHVHNDAHLGGHGPDADLTEDNYSNYEEYTKLYYRDYTGSGSPKSLSSLPLSFPAYSDAPNTYEDNLAKLFYNQAQLTQHFDSSDYNGNNRGYGGNSINMGISTENGSANIAYLAIDYLDSNLGDVDDAITNDGIDPGTTPTIVWQKFNFGNFDYYDYQTLYEGPGVDSTYYMDLARGKGQIMYSPGLWGQMDNTLDRLRINYTYRGSTVSFISANPKDTFTYNAVPDRKTSQQMATLFPENIRYIAALYQLFWEKTHPTATLVSLSISGSSSISENSSGTYTAKATLSDGSTPTVSPTWTVSTLAGTSISSSGQLTAGSVSGDTPVVVSASYTLSGITKTASKSVTIVNLTGASLTGLSISGPATINENNSGQFVATAYFSDGSAQTVTASASWFDNSSATTISSSGVLSAGSVGSDTPVTVSASYLAGGITKTASANVTIVNSGGGGTQTQQLIVNGGFENGTTGWSATTVAGGTVPSTGIGALSYPHAPGSWYGYLGNVDNALGSVHQFITIPANAQSVTLSFYLNVVTTEITIGNPPFDVMEVNLRTTGDTVIRKMASYSEVDKGGNVNGAYTLKTMDLTPYIAAYKGQQVLIQFYVDTDGLKPTVFRIDDVSAQAVLPLPVTLTSLSINGPSSVTEGHTAQYSATAIFSDGSTQTVTPSTWGENSSATTISSSGLLTAGQVSADTSVSLYAAYTSSGVTRDAYKDVTVLNVAPTFSYLDISGPSSINENSSGQFTATAIFSDGSSQSVSPNWLENSPATSISASGQLTAGGVSSDTTITVSASHTIGGVTRNANQDVLIVNIPPPVTLSSLSISGPSSLNENSAAQFTATASFSDGSSQGVIPTWSVDSAATSISIFGLLNAGEVASDTPMTVSASYSFGGITRNASKSVTVVNGAITPPTSVIFSNYGPENGVCTSCSYWDTGEHLPEQPYHRGMPFTVPPGTSFRLDSINVTAFQIGTVPPVYIVSVNADSGGVPGVLLEQFTFSNFTGTSHASPILLTETSVLHPVLSAGTQYWLTTDVSSPTTMRVGWPFNNQGSTGLVAWHAGNAPWSRPWGSTPQTLGAFSITGRVIGPTVTALTTGNNLTLLWPDSAAGYRVESALSLSPPTAWSNVTGTFQTNGGFISIVLPVVGPQKFFRLVKP